MDAFDVFAQARAGFVGANPSDTSAGDRREAARAGISCAIPTGLARCGAGVSFAASR
jgi:hypothetical protein